MKPEIFISHGAKEEWVVNLRSGLHAALSAGDFKPLLDKNELQEAAGEKWPEILHHWVCTCHAAVILLDSRAKDSHWVQAEALWLHLRASRDGLFVLPVGCDITFNDLPDILQNTAGLREAQWMAADKSDVGGTVARILEKLKEKAPKPRNMSDPWTTIVMDAMGLLRKAAAHGGAHDAVQRVAYTLNKAPQFQQWSPQLPWAALLADWLFSEKKDSEIEEKSLELCARAIRCLALSGEERKTLLDLVAKARFDEEPLKVLPSMLAQPGQVFALHPNASVIDAVEPTKWQLQRPFPSSHEPICLPVLRRRSDADDDLAQVQELIDDLQRAVDDEVGVNADTDLRTKAARRKRWATKRMPLPTVFHVVVSGEYLLDTNQISQVIGQASCCLVSDCEQANIPLVGAAAPEQWALDRDLEYRSALSALR